MIWLALLLFQTPAQPPAQGPAGPANTLGAKVFATTCAIGYCHGAGGVANRGPRLLGRGFDPSFVDRVVRKGVPNSAMPAFEDRLKAAELKAVIDYVVRLSSTSAEIAEPVTASTPNPVQPAPAQAAAPILTPSQELFFDAQRAVRCSTCHEWQGKGIKVAPYTPGASLPAARKIVKRVRLQSGQSFPAVIVADAEGAIKAYDLTAPPPVLRTLPKSEVASMDPETQWTHAQAVTGYTPVQIQTITSGSR